MLEQVSMQPCPIEGERRCGVDRRTHSVKTLWHALHGRRALGRRKDDHINALVDRYEPHLLFVFVMTFGLCCLDAFFTLHLISLGKATEANPVMDVAIAGGTLFFVLTKLAMTATALTILLWLNNYYFFKRIRVRYFLYGVLLSYVVLIKYQIWLFHI